jgi:Pheromone A receptor
VCPVILPTCIYLNKCDAEYIVTPYSYGIFEDIGCQTLTSFTVPGVPLFLAWPFVIGCLSFVYCGTYARLISPSSPPAHLLTAMALYLFIKHKRQVAEVTSSHQGLHRSRYIRLMLLACSDMLITVPFSLFSLIYAFKTGLTKFSWSTLRHNYTHVPQFSTVEWQNNTVEYAILEMDAWSLVYSAFIFFAFFGFADEARDHYRRVYSSITRRIRLLKSSGALPGSSHAYVAQSEFVMLDSRLCSMTSESSETVTATVTVFVAKSRNKRDSILSFCDQLSIPSISIAGDLESDFEIEQDSPLESTVPSSSSSFADRGPLDHWQLPQFPDEVDPMEQLTSTYTTDGADIV